MKELEVKILNASHEKLEQKLLSLGAKKVSDSILDAYFFDNEKCQIRNEKETLRVRTEGEKIILTHKKRIASENVKVREETEIEVSSLSESKKILESLGFNCFDNIKKRRITYKIENVKFEFDIHKGDLSFIPEFLEIEGPSAEVIYNYAEKLGFKKSDCTNYSITELKEIYSKS